MTLIYETNIDILPWTFMSRNVHEACADGRTTELEEMAREGADLNEPDELGNTPLWLAYVGGHLDTVFALLELGVDMNQRGGSMMASDFHRACGWGDEVFIDILCDCGADLNLTDGFCKTPLIYAIEYRTSLSDSNHMDTEEELVRLLINKGADVNHADMSGLTPLFYAIYRGVPSIVQLLLNHGANFKFENSLGYSPFRYALGCLSYANPMDISIYQRRLHVVELLLEQFQPTQSNEIELKQAIVGYSSSSTIPLLFPLFDFIFYSRTQYRSDLERIGWNAFDETYWPCESTYGNLLVAQNIVVFNQNIGNIVYFLQRMHVMNYGQLIVFYLQRVIKDKETTNRFLLLLYVAFVEMGGNRAYVVMLRHLLETQRIYLFKARRETIKSILSLCQQAPVRLSALCRQTIRQYTKSSIDRRVALDHLLPKSLQQYLIIEELSSFAVSLTIKRLLLLMQQSIRSDTTMFMYSSKGSSSVIDSSSTLSNNSNKNNFVSSFNHRSLLNVC